MKRVLIFLAFMGLLYGEYYREDLVVTDVATAFVWQDGEYSQSELDAYSEGNVTGKVQTFANAITYCENLNFAGYDDWRVPNFIELYLLVDRNSTAPAIDTTFESVPNGKYWSSTTVENDESMGWVVDFEHGNSEWLDKDTPAYVRCIRN
jgi:hypothetical protein